MNQEIYVVYCKDDNGITILKKAYSSESQAYQYVINKITQLLDIIVTDYKENSQYKVLPVGAQIIYNLYHSKNYNYIEQYEYFKEHHVKFFQYVAKQSVMFYISPLQLI